jgi:hypothetical protein
MLTIPIEKPRDFFRTVPDKSYRPQAMIFTHKVEGVIETEHYIVGPKMRGRMKDEARMCTLVCVVDRVTERSTKRPRPSRIWPRLIPRSARCASCAAHCQSCG